MTHSLLGFCSSKVPTCLMPSWCLLPRGPRPAVNYLCQYSDFFLACWNPDTTVTGTSMGPLLCPLERVLPLRGPEPSALQSSLTGTGSTKSTSWTTLASILGSETHLFFLLVTKHYTSTEVYDLTQTLHAEGWYLMITEDCLWAGVSATILEDCCTIPRYQLLLDIAYVTQKWTPLSWSRSHTSFTVKWLPWSDAKLWRFHAHG